MLIACCMLLSFFGSTHTLPHSVLLLDIRKDGIKATLSLPFDAFFKAYPQAVSGQGMNPEVYVRKHISISDSEGRSWGIRVEGTKRIETKEQLTGSGRELQWNLWLQPPAGASVRKFTLEYDLIMHRLTGQTLSLKVTSDWYGGMTCKDSVDADLGKIAVDPETGKSVPVEVNLERKASCWKGFQVFVGQGMEQIKNGNSYLLLLVVWMLSATFRVQNGRWRPAAGIRESLRRAVKIAGIFTLGYSLALVLAVSGWFPVSQQLIELAVYAAILLAAIQCMRPVFTSQEAMMVLISGLISGWDFSGALTDPGLDGERLVLSVLGFNIGVFLMLLFVVLCTVPWLILISKYPLHPILRMSGGLFALVASLSWILERLTGNPNWISDSADKLLSHGKWMIVGLALLGILTEIYQQVRAKKASSGITG